MYELDSVKDWYDNLHYEQVQSLRIATALMKQHYDIAATAVVERYPARRDWLSHEMVPGNVFAYQFFLSDGTNCGYWLPDLEDLMIFSKPRNWGIPKRELITVH